jgi:hypothetical protein
MVVDTRAAMDAGAPVIYEASFVGAGVFVSVDILERVPGGWCLIEVKSATKVKPVYVADAACQTHVLREAGLDIRRVEVMHLNRKCTHPDLRDLFVRTDITDRIEPILETLPESIDSLMSVVEGPLPTTLSGSHCRTPYPCPFLARCGPPEVPLSVDQLYRGGKKISAFRDQGVHTLDQIPMSAALSPIQSRQRRAARTGQAVFEDTLKKKLEPRRRFRMAFLDFESIQPAVPVWDGCHPYDAIPVQFSCHILGVDGKLVHREHLAEGSDDPRELVAMELLEACEGSSVVWTYSDYERQRIRDLKRAVPELADELADLSSRLVDLQPLIRNHVYHPEFRGSFSLKRVLPALVPALSYDEMDISDGQAASLALEALLLGDGPIDLEERTATRQALLAYCKLDTQAMVALWQTLVKRRRGS